MEVEMEIGLCLLEKERRIIHSPFRHTPLIWKDLPSFIDESVLFDSVFKNEELEKVDSGKKGCEHSKKMEKIKKKVERKQQKIKLIRESKRNYVNHLTFYTKSQKNSLANRTLRLSKEKWILQMSVCPKGPACRDRRIGHLANFSHECLIYRFDCVKLV